MKDCQKLLSRADGTFSFPVRSAVFLLQKVTKQGYQVVDQDVCRSYSYSKDPLYVVMEKPEQQQFDKLIKEKTLRSELQKKLAASENEIVQLNISLEEKNRMLLAMERQREADERTIKELADYYSRLDYDRLDESDRLLNACIEQCDIGRADSLLRQRGDIVQRAEEIKDEERIEKQKREELEQSIRATQQKKDRLAADCYSRYQISLLKHENDSASYYILLRSRLDTARIDYLLDAAAYMVLIDKLAEADSMYARAYKTVMLQAQTDATECLPLRGVVLNQWGIVKNKSGQITESEKMYSEALDIRMKLAADAPQTYEPYVAQTFNNLAVLYYNDDRIDEAVAANESALVIRRRLAESLPGAYDSDLAVSLVNLANAYMSANRVDESEPLYMEALSTYNVLGKTDFSQNTKAATSAVWANLSTLYFMKGDTLKCRNAYLRAIDSYGQLASVNPDIYSAMLDALVSRTGNVFASRDEAGYQQRVEVYRILAAHNPEKYSSHLATGLGNLSYYAILAGHFDKATAYAREGLSVDSSKEFIYANLVASLLFQHHYDEAMKIFSDHKSTIGVYLLDDFQTYSSCGLITPEVEQYVERIRQQVNSSNMNNDF